MNKILKVGLILMLYCLIASGALAIVQNITKDKIELQKELKKMNAMKSVIPDATKFEKVDTDNGFTYFKAYKEDTIIGYILETSGRGYSSDIVTIVGLDTTFAITSINILSQSETPGLGTKAVESSGGNKPWFQTQFENKKAEDILLDKDGGKLKSLTGATITSRAITKSIQTAIHKLKNELSNLNVQNPDSVKLGE